MTPVKAFLEPRKDRIHIKSWPISESLKTTEKPLNIQYSQTQDQFSKDVQTEIQTSAIHADPVG